MKKLLSSVFYILSVSVALSQGTVGSSQKTYAPTVIPPSPNAASLGKYGEIPVGYYTGIPSISIPLVTAQNKDIAIPVSLSYHPSVKVEEIASWVGLGWSLNAGGMISRSIVGMPDDLPSVGYLYNTYSPSSFFQTNGLPLPEAQRKAKYEEVENMVTGSQYDLQPDVFNFSFGGNSGKFYIDKTDLTKGFTLEKQNIFIQPVYGAGYLTTITGFIVYDGSGNKYVFGAGEVEQTNSVDGGDYNVTAWLLKEITSTNGTKISFEYESYTNFYLTKPFEVYEVLRYGQGGTLAPSAFAVRRSQNNTYVQGKQLKKINFENGYIEFVKDITARLDLASNPNVLTCYPLKEVRLFDKSNVLIKSFKMKYGYFTETMANNSSNGYETEGTQPLRLKLEEVQEYGNSASKCLPPHKFTYFNGNLANRFSNSQDHWGYNNEQPNTSLIPICIGSDNLVTRTLGFANRAPKESSTKYGVLQKIEYPTGGSTEFDFELNECFTQEFKFPPLNFQEICPSSTDYTILETIQTDPNATPNVNPTIRTNVSLAAGSYYFEVQGTPTGAIQGFFQNINYTTRFFLKNLTTNTMVLDNYDPTNFIPLPNCASCPPPVEYLTAGNYELKIEIRNTDDGGILLSPTVSNMPFVKILMKGNSMPLNVDYNKKIGGLRIIKMTTFDGIDPTKNIIKEFRYNDIIDNTKSSGKLVNIPNYFSLTAKDIFTPSPLGGDITGPFYYITIQSNTTSPLASTRGGVLGYKYVEVLDGLGGINGKTLYNYTTAETYPDIVDDIYPFTPSTDFDLKRGFEKSITIFRKDSPAVYTKVSQTDNTENYSMSKQYIAVLHGCSRTGYDVLGGPDVAVKLVCREPIFEKYTIEAGWLGKISSLESFFDQNDINKVMTKNTAYEYYDEADRLLLKKVTTDEANTDPVTIASVTTQVNRKKQILYKYPKDFAVAGNDYQLMVDRKIVNPVIQEETFLIKKNTNGTDATPIPLFLKKTSHKKWYNAVVAGSVETSPPIFAPEKVETQIGTNSIFTEITYNTYDAVGNLTNFTERNGISTNIEWFGTTDLGKTNLIKAQVKGVGNAAISQRTELDYYPIIGVKTTKDPAGLFTYYNYDGLNRLLEVKDNNNKVIKSYSYNYKSNLVGCNAN